MNKRLWWLVLPLAVAGLDLGSKALVVAKLSFGQLREIIPGFFNITFHLNRGAIFGSLEHAPEWARILIFTVAGLAALGYFGYEFLKEDTPRLQRIALGMILGGAVGNGVDRLWHGAVVDFLDFILFGWHYWTFNLADSAIVCGAILVGWSLLRQKSPQPSPEA